jgi:hypothetical protein
MSKIKFIAVAMVMAGAGSLLIWEHSLNEKLRLDNDSLRGAVAELKQAQSEREPVAADNSLSTEQLSELLKLRGEVTGLRERTNEMVALRQRNEALRASLKTMAASTPKVEAAERKKTLPEDALPQDIHPKESWAYRGYGSPEATVESMLWAISKGDKATFLGGMSPEEQARLEKELEGKDFAAEAKTLNPTEFRVLDRQVVSDDEMVMTVYSVRQKENGDADSNSQDMNFKRINGEWKAFHVK